MSDQPRLVLTRDDYCAQIDKLGYEGRVTGLLRALVCAHINHVIPPNANEYDVEALKKADVPLIVLEDHQRGLSVKQEFLTVMLFVPDDAKVHRQFVYLARHYLHGSAVPVNPYTTLP